MNEARLWVLLVCGLLGWGARRNILRILVLEKSLSASDLSNFAFNIIARVKTYIVVNKSFLAKIDWVPFRSFCNATFLIILITLIILMLQLF